jgi:hypothetical protein
MHIIKKWIIKPAAGKIKWIEKYDDMNLDSEFWQHIYEMPFVLTKNSKVLMTQYKIINRILAVNYNLKIWKKTDRELCESCKQIAAEVKTQDIETPRYVSDLTSFRGFPYKYSVGTLRSLRFLDLIYVFLI